MFIVNPHSTEPIYRQLLEQVRRMASSGQLPPGAALPSVREVALAHAVNPMTVSKAYALLEAEGLVERNRGKQMTIASRPQMSTLLPKRLQQIDGHLEQLVLAARQLGLPQADVMKALRRKWEESDE